MSSLQEYTQAVATNARKAATALAEVTGRDRHRWLLTVAEELVRRTEDIVTANEKDLAQGRADGLSDAMLDRLRLTPDRLQSLADAVLQIAALPDPVGEVIEGGRRPNGLQIEKIRVPLGVVFFIYESRPNVTIDAAAICVKAGNAVILRGGKEAFHSNQALQQVLLDCLKKAGLPEHAVQLVSTTDREAVGQFLKMGQLIDVTIPRGGRSLIERVTAEATMPVIKHFDGICHVYLDASADVQMSVDITTNSKCQRPGVCNAAETLLIHRDAVEGVMPAVVKALQDRGVELRCCERSQPLVAGAVAATDEDYSTEYLALILSVKIVDSLDEAVEHIRRFGSGHTEAIVTSDLNAAQAFERKVDSSAVMINASTRFNDGGEFGLGAEIGISTDRFHARGPCGLREITSYKYVVRGTGQVR
ncbi:MAG: glutamate-5-semialdehyde dehydrogenase [Planctomycetaceae bacterium]